ncbi:hypothetical protein E3J51_03540 [Candidatus Bathyarchaeota archaeon]|nr:MAG: hypothetical protein E3J51_03540 [Candidatus Bathyarchaeota archaeon]
MLPQLKICGHNEEYENIVSEAVDKTLNQVLGSAAANAIYFYLEKDHAIKKNEIPEKLESFCEAIQEYLSTGAAMVEKQILRNFYSNLELYEENSPTSSLISSKH